MLIDRYPAEDIFARVPQIIARIDPVLKQLDRLLDDDALYQQVRNDFGKRHRQTLVHGRHSTPVEVLLRLLILKHLYQWSYQEAEDQVDQNLILRWFCRVYWGPVPDDTTLLRWAPHRERDRDGKREVRSQPWQPQVLFVQLPNRSFNAGEAHSQPVPEPIESVVGPGGLNWLNGEVRPVRKLRRQQLANESTLYLHLVGMHFFHEWSPLHA